MTLSYEEFEKEMEKNMPTDRKESVEMRKALSANLSLEDYRKKKADEEYDKAHPIIGFFKDMSSEAANALYSRYLLTKDYYEASENLRDQMGDADYGQMMSNEMVGIEPAEYMTPRQQAAFDFTLRKEAEWNEKVLTPAIIFAMTAATGGAYFGAKAGLTGLAKSTSLNAIRELGMTFAMGSMAKGLGSSLVGILQDENKTAGQKAIDSAQSIFMTLAQKVPGVSTITEVQSPEWQQYYAEHPGGAVGKLIYDNVTDLAQVYNMAKGFKNRFSKKIEKTANGQPEPVKNPEVPNDTTERLPDGTPQVVNPEDAPTTVAPSTEKIPNQPSPDIKNIKGKKKVHKRKRAIERAKAKFEPDLDRYANQLLMAEHNQQRELDRAQAEGEYQRKIKKKVSEGKLKPPPLQDEERAIIASGEEVDYEIQHNREHPPMLEDGGGRVIPIANSNINHNVSGEEVAMAVDDVSGVYQHAKSLPRGVLGSFNNITNEIRSRGTLRVGTIAHELGHFIDKVFNIEGYEDELSANSKAIWKNGEYASKHKLNVDVATGKRAPKGKVEQKKLDAYNATMVREGRAEFVREYIFNPEEAQKNFPNYFKAFEAKMSQFPELKSKFDNMSEVIRKWETQPGTARVGAGSIQFANQVKPIGNPNIRKRTTSKIKKQLFDRYQPLQDIAERIEDITGQKLVGSMNFLDRMKALTSSVSAMRYKLLDTSFENNPYATNSVESCLGMKKGTLNKVSYVDIFAGLDDRKFKAAHPEYFKKSSAKNIREVLSEYLIARNTLERTNLKATKHRPEVVNNINSLSGILSELKLKKEGLTGDKSIARIDKKIAKVTKQLAHETKRLEIIDNQNIDIDVKLPTADTPKEILKTIQHNLELIEMAPPEIVKAAEKFKLFNQNTLRIAEQLDLITPELRKALEKDYQYYLPWLRAGEGDMFENVLDKSGAGSKLVNQGKFMKETSDYGSDRLIKDPLVNYEENINNLLSRGYKNQVGKALLEVTKLDGVGDILANRGEVKAGTTTDPRDMEFTVYDKGKKIKLQTTDKLFYDTLTSQSPAMSKVAVVNYSHLFTDFYRWCTTNTPGFALANALRDTVTAFVTDPSNKLVPIKPIWDTVQNMWDMTHNDPMRDMFETSGAQFAGVRRNSAQVLNSQMERMGVQTKFQKRLSAMHINPNKGLLHGALQLIAKPLNIMQKTGDLIEAAPRYGAFKRTIKRTGGRIVDGQLVGGDIQKAAKAARNITVDFTQGGESSKAMNTIVPFFNASLQGTSTIAKAIFTGDKKHRAIVFGRISLLMGSTAALWSLTHDNPVYRNMSEDIKNRYWVIPAGDKAITIPKPELIGVPCSVIERVLDYYADRDEQAPKSLIPYVQGVITPSIIPAVLRPILEYTQNKDFFTGKAIVPSYMEKDYHPAEQTDNTDSYLGKQLGSMFNVSPKHVDKLIVNIFSNYGREALSISNMFSPVYNKVNPAKSLEKYPVFDRFVRNPLRNNAVAELFQSTLQEAKKDTNAATMFDKNGVRLTKRAKKKASRLQSSLENVEKWMQKDRKKTKELNLNQKLSAEAKRDKEILTTRKHLNKMIEVLQKNGKGMNFKPMK